MDNDQIVREQLLSLLRGGNAHMTFDQAVSGFPMQQINQQLNNAPYSAWQLLEHMRIALWDIVKFIREPDYKEPVWPEGYWPKEGEQGDQETWERTVLAIRTGIKALEQILQDPQTDLYRPIPHAPDYSILREILVIADHNAYHLGEFAILRGLLGNW